MSFWEWAFWGSLALVLYPYLFYPALIITASRIKKALFPRRLQDPVEWPEVTIVIPAYKEARSVAPKMESIRRLDYPKDKLRVLWVIATHDGDESFLPTMQALKSYPEAQTLIVPHRGKIYSLNEARKHVNTPYILISDADIVLSQPSLREAVRQAEADPRTGLVGGIRYVLPEGHFETVSPNESVYLGYEQRIAMAESAWGCALGVGGGFLLVRKAFWVSMPPGVADDLYLNLEVGLRGARCVLEPRARGYEIPSDTVQAEFRRKVRIAYTAFRALVERFTWREAIKAPLFAFFLISHKIFRYIVAPLALIILTVSLAALALRSDLLIYGIAFAILALAWIQAYVMWEVPGLRFPGLLSLPGYFILAHMAQLAGFWKFLRGEDPLKVWQRLPRTELQPSRP